MSTQDQFESMILAFARQHYEGLQVSAEIGVLLILETLCRAGEHYVRVSRSR